MSSDVTPRVNPAYQFMPPLELDDRQELREGIQRFGPVYPVVVDETGAILDGHTRAAECAALGRTPDYIVKAGLTEEEKVDLVWVLNLGRRHLTLEQKRALIRQRLATRPDLSDRSIAREIKVSPSTVGSIRHEMEEDPSVQIEQTIRPHQRTDDGLRSPRGAAPVADSEADEPTERNPVEDAADHRQMCGFELTIRYPAPTDERRRRAGLPYVREQERREWYVGPRYLTCPAPRNLDEARALVREIAEHLWREINARPLATMGGG